MDTLHLQIYIELNSLRLLPLSPCQILRVSGFSVTMVFPLRPGKFYGSCLPRPWIYNDVKFSKERVDPPAPVTDLFMAWAGEAHWSMGGLSFKRLRLQGRIEGSLKKLRAEREEFFRGKEERAAMAAKRVGEISRTVSPSPPPAPIAGKRKRFMASIPEDDNDDEVKARHGGATARKLSDDFDRVALESGMGKRGSIGTPLQERPVLNLRSRRVSRVAANVDEEGGEMSIRNKVEMGFSTPPVKIRTSSRLLKRSSC